MIDLTGTSAELVKYATSATPLWLARLLADSLSLGEVPQRYGSDVYVDWDTDTWEDLMDSLALGAVDLLLKGGVAVQADAQLRLRNEGRLSNLTSSFSLENDVLELFQLFDNGANDADDLIPLFRGLVNSYPSDVNRWTLSARDSSRADWRATPNRLIGGDRFPLSPDDTIEGHFYVPFGIFEQGPYDDAGTSRYLVPCQCVDYLVDARYTAGITNYSGNIGAGGQVYQGYDGNRLLAEVVDYTYGTIAGYGAFFTVDSIARRMVVRPNRKGTGNNVDDWGAAADGRTSVSVAVGVGSSLVLHFAGVPKSGTLTEVNVFLFATGGTYDWSLDHGGDNLGSAAAVSGDLSITGILVSRWADIWDFELLKLTVTPVSATVQVEEEELELLFDDQTVVSQQGALPLFAKAQGAYDDTNYYEDGPLIVEPPASPAAALEAGGALSSGTPYYYVVTAVDAGGQESTQSAEVTATPSGGNLTIGLTWTAVVWAESYRIYRTTSEGVYGATSRAGTATAAAFTDAGETLTTGTPPDAVVFTNPVDLVQAILRRRDSLRLAIAKINKTSFDVARGKRAGWTFGFVLGLEQWTGVEALNPMLQEAGCHLWKNAADEWTIVARDKDAAPQHALISQWNIPVVDPDADYQDQRPDISSDRVKNEDLVNSFLIRAQQDLTIGTYNVKEIASSDYQRTGVGSTESATEEFVLGAGQGSLVTWGVSAGWIFYLDSDQAYRATGDPSSATRVGIEPVLGDTVFDNGVGTEFWAGVNLDENLLRSFRRYKSVQHLGRPTRGARDPGGYEARHIADAATAVFMLTHWTDFHADLPALVTTAAFAGHIDMEPGDVVVLHDPQLADKLQGDSLTTLAAEVAAIDADMLAVDFGAISEDDTLLLGYGTTTPEVVTVGEFDEGTNRWPITRAVANTQAATHASGSAVIRLRRKWEIISLRKPEPRDPVCRLKLLELPYSYSPVLTIAPDSLDDWDAMDEKEKALYRAITGNGGLIDDRDGESLAVIGAD